MSEPESEKEKAHTIDTARWNPNLSEAQQQ